MTLVRPLSWPAFRTLLAPLFALALCMQTAHAQPSTVVVFVGGLGSTTASTSASVTPVVREIVPRGLGVRVFDYGAAASSCQSIDTSAAALAAYVGGLRDRGEAERVILVGHSNGGVVAIGVLAIAPELATFVQRVVTVDSPLEGIPLADAMAYGARFGACPAADELYGRSLTAGWPEYLGQLEAWQRDRGTDVRVVVNTADAAVLPEQQQIAGDAAYVLEASDPSDWTNHAALLHVPAAAAQLAAIVAGL